MTHPSDIEIARAAQLRPIEEIGARLGIPADGAAPVRTRQGQGRRRPARLARRAGAGKLVLVTAISPTPAGEGKTTTTVGLGDALNAIGRRAVICLREPSLGPCFGRRAAHGRRPSQVVPMEEINLHFTGDFHAITAAHNLLAAMIDNHIHWGNALGIDPRRVTWRRVLDMNDRALRDVVVGLGGARERLPARDRLRHHRRLRGHGDPLPRRATSPTSSARLGRIVVGQTRDRRPVTAARPQGRRAPWRCCCARRSCRTSCRRSRATPRSSTAGPSPTSPTAATRWWRRAPRCALGDIVVTEAGFGADLGAEKFFDIKCRKAGLAPDAAVIVATVRALKMQRRRRQGRPRRRDLAAVRRGSANLGRHIANVRRFGVPSVVAVNHFHGDTEAEIDAVRAFVAGLGVEAIVCRHWAEGGAGAVDLAGASRRSPTAARRISARSTPTRCRSLDKIGHGRPQIYGADGVVAGRRPRASSREFEAAGHGHLPVCMAKTQYSFSTDPTASAPRSASSCRSATSASRPGPASSSRSAARS